MPAITITALNQKGGVGKTSTCYHLAGTLARDGRRVLLLDMDPQASLTQGFWGPDAMRALPRRETVAALFGDGLIPGPAELVRPTGFDGVSLVPGSGHLTEFNVPRPEREPADQQRALREFVAEARGDFDVILVDCPPNLHLCSWAALVASDHLICPLGAEDFAAQGISAILDCVEAVQAGPNRRLALLGYLITMFNPRLAIHRAYESMLREMYAGDVLAATVPLGTDFKEAIAQRKPIAAYKPRGASARAVKAVADEILARVGAGGRVGTDADREAA